MYSPPTGGAARRPSVTIDKNQTSNRRFIICGEKDYLRGYDIAQALGRDRRARRVFADDLPQVRDPTSLHPLRRAPDLPTFAASGSGQTYRRGRALLPG